MEDALEVLVDLVDETVFWVVLVGCDELVDTDFLVVEV